VRLNIATWGYQCGSSCRRNQGSFPYRSLVDALTVGTIENDDGHVIIIVDNCNVGLYI
jgi:hypothetical protein